MSGFELRNESGVLQISSDFNKSLVAGAGFQLFSDNNPLYWLATVGILSGVAGRVNNLFGLRNASGMFVCDPNLTYWCNIPSGASICRVDNYLGGNTATVNIREATNRNINHLSGYLDVFNAAGELTWSAASLASVPNIKGSANFDRAGVIEKGGGSAIAIEGEPYFMLNALNGFVEYSDEGSAETYAVCIFRSGNTYYCFSEYYRPGAGSNTPADALPPIIAVPYAYF